MPQEMEFQSKIDGTRQAMIAARGLTVRYKGSPVAAVKGLNLRVGKGELYGLLGANGAGKTSTLKAFLGFLPPASGNAYLNGFDVHSEPLSARAHVAYVSERVRLYGNFTARANLDYFARLAGKTHLKQADYDDILAQVGLEKADFSEKVRNFSKGMTQKLSIAVALAKDADAILLDEPTTGLDPKAAAEFTRLISDIRQNKAILMCTHDIFRVKDLATQVGIMKRGQLVTERTRDQLAGDDLQQLYLDYMSADGH